MNRIKEARKKAGMSQKFVAMELGVASPSVSNWESGKTNPTNENIKALAALFNVSADYLLGIDEPQPTTTPMPIDPHTYYAEQFGPETQAIIDELLAKLQAMPEDKREDAAKGALTFVRGLENERKNRK